MNRTSLSAVILVFINILFHESFSFAGAYPISVGSVKTFSEFSLTRSRGVFDDQGTLVKRIRDQCNAQVLLSFCEKFYKKQQAKIFIEAGATSFLTLLFEGMYEKEKSYRIATTTHQTRSLIGFRFNLFHGNGTAISVENSYGYSYEKRGHRINKGPYAQVALQLGFDWKTFNILHTYLTNSVGFERNWQRNNPDLLFYDATLALEIPEALLGFKLAILNDAFFRLETSGQSNRRVVEIQYQPSLLFFATDNLGLQLGYRMSLFGRNTNAERTAIAKIWLAF